MTPLTSPMVGILAGLAIINWFAYWYSWHGENRNANLLMSAIFLLVLLLRGF
jgi:hypothetical protein